MYVSISVILLDVDTPRVVGICQSSCILHMCVRDFDSGYVCQVIAIVLCVL